MADRSLQLIELGQQIRKHAVEDGLHQSALHPLVVFKESQSHGRTSWIYEPALVIAAQGKKNIYLDGKRYEYSAGSFLALFMPMAVECEVVEVSEEEPLLGIGIRLDRHKLAELLLRIDSIEHVPVSSDATNSSGIFSSPITENLLDASIRLLKTLDNPTEAAILGNSIIDEIYYRILCGEQDGALRTLLWQQGQIQQISRAVEHLHQNLTRNVSIDELARLVNMSSSGFHMKFKEVMHLSPLQYTKLIRLNKAKSYIKEGKKVNEAAYMTGYNSPAQFSREYKRQFGTVPSAT